MNITIGRKDGDPLSFTATPDEKILYAALRNKITVPYECATGTCGSCRAKLVSGDLDYGWENAPGRKALKIKRGEFLMCQCVAQSNCEIRIPTPVAIQDTEEPAPQTRTGTISDFRKLTDDVLSFHVALQHEVTYKAGQFMLLQLPGVEGARAYSMVNHARQTDRLEFVVKQLKGGKGSDWLFTAAEENTDTVLFGPIGRAVFEPELNHDLLLLAGGSGIAGMMAMLSQADQIGYLQSNRIDMIFGVRTNEDIFYLQTLSKLAEKYPNSLQIKIALSDEDGDKKSKADSQKNLNIVNGGFVHEHIAQVQTIPNTMAFIAGPPPMVDASIRELIAGCGLSVGQIRYDKFA